MAKKICKAQLPAKLVVLLTFTLLLPLAHANVLSNGSFTTVSPASPTGSIVATASGTITTPLFTATYIQQVMADPGNTWCAGCLDFMYMFTNLGGVDLGRFTMFNFTGFSTFVATSPFGVNDPSTVDRNTTGSTIGYNYTAGLGITPGTTTPWLIIETNATHVVPGFLSAQDGTAGFGNAWAPSVVPEPGSLVLMGGGLIALGGYLRKSLFGR